MPAVAAVTEFLQQIAPLELAADWDNVGLLLGDSAAPVARLMTCLTVTPEVAAEAIAARADLIITHHPIFFRPTKRLVATAPDGRMLWSLARAGIAVYSPHTALDNAQGGINDLIARRLGLTEVGPLRSQTGPGHCKVVVFVPESDLQKVSDAMFAAGAGHIGQYGECSFRLAGTGTFFGSEAANPTVGQKGRREEVSEWRLEVLCPEADLARVIAALRKAHSYEEPAFDIYPLRSEPSRIGSGRIGVLPEPASLGALAQTVKSSLGASLVQVAGEPSQAVRRVAVVCGAGGDFLSDAALHKADVLVTGEVRFHDCLAARALNLALMLPGHYASERCGIEDLAERLSKHFPGLEIWASRSERDPLGQCP